MTTRGKFDRYMVASGAARHVKFRRLNTNERHAFFMGVLSIAAQAPVRGCLLVGDLHAEAADIAGEADVNIKVAESALEKLRQVGVIYTDDELGCERVHDFEDWNPAPKVDGTNAERQRRYRERLAASRNAVTNAVVTPPEVEVEGNTPQSPPGGKVVKFRRRPVPAETLAVAEKALATFNHLAGQNVGAYRSDGGPSDSLTRILGAITDKPDKLTGGYCDRLVADTLKRRWWGDDPPSIGVVFGPKVLDRNIAALDGQTSRSMSSAELAELYRNGAA